MIRLVLGGASSGKSGFAERLACEAAAANGTRPVYLATMQPYGEAGRVRVERHRAMREGKGFRTLECYGSLADAEVEPGSTVLLECLGNLVANLQFGEDWQQVPDEQVYSVAAGGFGVLASRCADLVVVSNEVGSDGGCYGDSTESYIDIMGRLTACVAAQAHEVYEVVAGVPCIIKKEDPFEPLG